MRRFGIHGVVALAGLVACSRFDSGDGAPSTQPDASTPNGSSGPDDSGSSASPDTGGADGGTQVVPDPFCKNHLKAMFCADFEDGEPTVGVNAPKGANGFTHEAAITSGGRKALKLTAVKPPDTWGLEQGAFNVPLSAASLTSATLQLDVMCETSDFTFTRVAGFQLVAKGTPMTLSLGGQGPGNALFQAGDPLSAAFPNGMWVHLEMKVATTVDQKLETTNITVNDMPLSAPKALDLKDGPELSAGFGIWDTAFATTNEVVVWIDNVVLTTSAD